MSSEEKMQQYHDFLVAILNSVKVIAKNKPFMWVNLGSKIKCMRIIIQVAIVMGNQKLQDYIFGRKSSNTGAACQVHCSCMASAVMSTTGGCHSKAPYDVIQKLNSLALLDISDGLESGLLLHLKNSLPLDSRLQKHEYQAVVSHLCRVQKLAKGILSKTFCMHPIRNAFKEIPFGANSHGILVATTDNHMHSCESGVLLNMAKVTYHGLLATERNEFERIIRSKVVACRSSVLYDYPCCFSLLITPPL